MCQRKSCSSWQLTEAAISTDPNQLEPGMLVECHFVHSLNESANTCITPVHSSTSMPTPTASSSQSALPLMSEIPSPTASQTPLDPSPSSSIQPSPSASPFPSASPTSSVTPSPRPAFCEQDNAKLDITELFPVNNTPGNITHTISYAPSLSLRGRVITENDCVNPFPFTSTDDAIDISYAPYWDLEPPEGWIAPANCLLSSAGIESFQAVILEADGFTFQPIELDIFDVDNDQWRSGWGMSQSSTKFCKEATAVFGMINGNVVTPTAEVSGPSPLRLEQYRVPESTMLALGFDAVETMVIGGQMSPTTTIEDRCDASNAAECQLTFSFDQAIDTLVIFMFYAQLGNQQPFPGHCTSEINIRSPIVSDCQ